MNDLMRLQIHYDLPPSLAKILVLLADNEVVTARMIELDHKLTKDAKVAIHRLRRRLDGGPIAIQSRRDVGYWVDDGARQTIRSIQGGSESSVGGAGDGSAAAA